MLGSDVWLRPIKAPSPLRWQPCQSAAPALVALVAMSRAPQRSLAWVLKPLKFKGRPWSLLRWHALLLLLLAVPLPALTAGVLRVGVLDGSPPCSLQKNRGQWQGRAVELWELIARREGLAYL